MQNGDGAFSSTISPTKAWVHGEMLKGSALWDVFATVPLPAAWFPPALKKFAAIRSQGGWSLNRGQFEFSGQPPPGSYPRTPASANGLSDEELRQNPLFKRFRNRDLLDPIQGSEVARDPAIRAEVLGAAIPALTHAVGSNPVNAFVSGSDDRNFNLNSADFQNGWPESRLNNQELSDRWLHSDLKDVAYQFNHLLYQRLIGLGGLNDN
jgi:hypothetical protein